MDKPPSSDKEPNSDDEEHFIDGNYFFNHLVRNKAAEDYNMAEMLRERSRELQKNHWLFSHSHNRYLRPHQQYGAYETDRLSTSLPADYPNKPPNYFYYQDDGHRIVSTESRNRHFDLHNNRRHQGPRHRDIPFAGGLEIEIPPRRHGGLGGGGLRQSISADRLLMVPHTHRDSAKFGRHYFRAGPSYDHNTSFSSYSATNLDVLPLHIETHVPHDVDVDQTASRLKGRTVALEHRGETDSDVAVLPDTKEHNHFRFSKRLPHNMFNDRPLENRYTGQETRHIANTGRYNVPTGRFEPVTGSHPYPKSGSNSDMLRSAVLNQYQSNSIPNSSSSLARDSSRTQFIADNERRTAYFQQNDSKLPSVQGTNHSIRKDFGTRTVVRVIGTEGVQNTHFRMNNRDNRGQAISSGGFHAPMKYSSMGNRTWNEHFHEGLNRDFPSADPRMSVSWDSSRFRAHSDKHYNQPPHWSHQQSHVFQRPFDVVDSSQSRPKHMDSVSFQNVQDSHEVQRANVSRSQHFDTSGRKVVTWQDQDLESDRLVRTERDVGEIQPILDPGNYGDGTFSREPSHSVIKDGEISLLLLF